MNIYSNFKVRLSEASKSQSNVLPLLSYSPILLQPLYCVIFNGSTWWDHNVSDGQIVACTGNLYRHSILCGPGWFFTFSRSEWGMVQAGICNIQSQARGWQAARSKGNALALFSSSSPAQAIVLSHLDGQGWPNHARQLQPARSKGNVLCECQYI